MSTGYNPDFNPTGIEGGVDTNSLPWIDLPQAPGVAIKPLRASMESGMFSTIVRLRGGTELSGIVYLGGMDQLVLSGSVTSPDGPLAATASPGIWSYAPANSKVDRATAQEDTEILANFYGPIAFLASDGQTVTSLLTAVDVAKAARDRGITLVPNTLAECMQPRPDTPPGQGEPLAIAGSDAAALVTRAQQAATAVPINPHYVDTRTVPWIRQSGSARYRTEGAAGQRGDGYFVADRSPQRRGRAALPPGRSRLPGTERANRLSRRTTGRLRSGCLVFRTRWRAPRSNAAYRRRRPDLHGQRLWPGTVRRRARYADRGGAIVDAIQGGRHCRRRQTGAKHV